MQIRNYQIIVRKHLLIIYVQELQRQLEFQELDMVKQN